jgi:hypothetical protein
MNIDLWVASCSNAGLSAVKQYAYFLAPQLFRHAYSSFVSHFLLIWLLLLLFIVAFGLRLSGWQSSLGPRSASNDNPYGAANHPWHFDLKDGISVGLLLVFLGAYIFQIFYKETFAYYDDDMLTEFSVQGKNFPAPVWPDTGRFYPLADQEFNLLKFFTRSPAGYHFLVVVQLVVLTGLLFVALREFKIRYRVLVLISVLVAPSFLISFSGFVYPERNVLFWLTVLVLCLLGYARNKAPGYFVGCLVATHCALYYKEPVVLFVVACAVARIVIDLRTTPVSTSRPWHVIAKDNALSLGMLVVSSIYVILFLAAMIPHHTFSYVAQHSHGLGAMLVAYVQFDWLPVTLCGVVALRVGWSIWRNGQLDPVWDSLGVGAIAYFVSIIGLRLGSGYYLAPVDFIGLLYLASMALLWLSKPTRVRTLAVVVTFIVILLQSVAYSSFRIVERKNIIATKSQLAKFLRGYQATTKGDTVELFFPYADNYHLMGISSYLRYEGFRLSGQSIESQSSGPRFVIEGQKEFINGRCIEYRDYSCVHLDRAPPGALIVVLPDDDVSKREVEQVSQGLIPLLSVNACEICNRKDSWFRRLHAVSAVFANRDLPEHWLQLDVFQEQGERVQN